MTIQYIGSQLRKAMKGRWGLLAIFLVVFLFISIIIRTVLLANIWQMINTASLPKIYGVGFFYDIVTALYFAIPLLLYLIVLPDRIFSSLLNRLFIHFVSFVALYILLFDGVAEYLFFDEFGTRFNFIAVDYLVYTTEVVRNIQESYHVPQVLLAISAVTVIVYLTLRKKIDETLSFVPTRLSQRLNLGIIFLLLPILSVSFVDQSYTKISQNTYANELASNGIYNLFAALKNNSIEYRQFYNTLGDLEALKLLRHELQKTGIGFLTNNPQDIRYKIVHSDTEKKLNVVVIMVESLSADFLGVYGNKDNLTPNLDRIAHKALLFRHAYATGTRTDRGLEAVTLSVPPTPGRSIVKRPDNENLFSWGQIMKSKGYDVKFIYGGYGYFDNMNYFFTHNGYRTIDRSAIDKKNIHFENVWGICDEDLFDKAISEFNASYEAGTPFFAHIMTTSNHRPFTYPEGRIDIPSKSGRNGAVKYTDYAIGKFLSNAEQQPWFKSTLFVIVADHCASSAGKMSLPLERYQIPLMVYSPAHVTPGVFDPIVSQIDIAPTVLGMLNFNYVSKFFGKDVLNGHQGHGKAFIGTYQKLGYVDDGMLVILDVKKQVEVRRISDMRSVSLSSTEGHEVVDKAIAYYQSASYLFEHKLNNWDMPKTALQKNIEYKE